jgi:DNA-binding XRE family transcriptional regulator
MNVHTEPQIITHNGEPAFAVIPWTEYKELISRDEPNESEVWFPNEVVKANVRGDSLVKAWREYLGLTQAELAVKAEMKQPALARLEKGGSVPRTTTLAKLADAMGLDVEQLID